MSYFSRVREFNSKFKTLPEKPTIGVGKHYNNVGGAMALVDEEYDEVDKAYGQLASCALFNGADSVSPELYANLLSELVDLCYVAMGMAANLGLPFDLAFGAIHEANMRKVTGEASFDQNRKVIKPEGWQGADIVSLVRKAQQYPIAAVEFPERPQEPPTGMWEADSYHIILHEGLHRLGGVTVNVAPGWKAFIERSRNGVVLYSQQVPLDNTKL